MSLSGDLLNPYPASNTNTGSNGSGNGNGTGNRGDIKPGMNESGFDALLEGLDAAGESSGNSFGAYGTENGEAGGADGTGGPGAARPSQKRQGSGNKRSAEDEEDGEDGKKKKGSVGGGGGGSASAGGGGGSSAHGANGLISCEACRRGKRRCEPSPLVAPTHPDAAKLPCARCRRFALECVRVRVPRRKGPAPVDKSAISDAVHGYASTSSGPGAGASGPGDDSVQGQNGYGQGPYAPPATQAYSQQPPPFLSEEERRRSSGISMDGYGMHGHGHGHGSAQGIGSSSGPSPSFPILTASSPSWNIGAIPDNLDQVVSGTVIDQIVGLFFDYVYPLTPCLHRPTFINNLTNRLDKTDPVFFALTLNVLASTLVQVPRSLVNLDKMEIENLARRCVKVARAKISYIWDESVPVQSTFIVIAYLEGIVHLLLGNNTAHVICTANANQLALAMRLNEESSYEGLDPIESEIRRRIYWLLFQADKSTACMRARSINLRLEDAAQLRLPAEVDDEQITPSGIMPQPIGRTPIIAGFNIVTNLFRTLNDALILQRRRNTPTVDSLLADLQSVNELREKVMRTAMDVATPLQLRRSMDSRVSSPAHDWEAKLQARFLDFFHAAGDESHALNSFLILQGNILVTQHVVRLVLLQTKEALLQQLAVITQMPVQGIGSLAGMQASEPAEDIATELLDGLNSLPVECVATNGPSLVQKVRFVAIQLMECSVSPSPTTARAQKLLMQFLSVLSVIEGMYTFGKDISAE